MKVVADQDIPFLKGALEPHAEVIYRNGRSIGPGDVRDADALIVRTRTRCNARLLRGSAVRFIATATIGFDHIDTAYCAARGIEWANAPGCNSSSVRQYIAAALLHVAEQRGWALAGKTIGIVGVGNVGTKVAALCQALGMNVLLNDPPRARREGSAEFVSLDEILQSADIITLHVPLEPAGPDPTQHLVNAALLARLAPHQLLINTSRGEVVDGAALRDALQDRRIAGCVLDVWEREPSIDLALMALCDLATPHIAGYSADGKANGTAMSVQAVGRYFNLGLDAWTPADVPLPAQPILDLAGADRTPQQLIARAVRMTYDIASDDARLRADPASFERQRTTHPFRREFHNYSVRSDRLGAEVVAQLTGMTFRIC